MYFDDVRVCLGDMTLLEEKIQRLDAILPELEGEDGVLHMEAYSESHSTFTFTRDDAPTQPVEINQ